MKICPMRSGLCVCENCGWWVQDKGCAMAVLADGMADLPACLDAIADAVDTLTMTDKEESK